MSQRTDKLLHWIPRIASIIFILFLAVFSLDIFDGGYGFWGTILGLLVHNIPSFVLLAVLIISWKHELVGGIVFTLAGLLYISMILVSALRNGFEWHLLSYSFIISGPAFIIGILFVINWLRSRRVNF